MIVFYEKQWYLWWWDGNLIFSCWSGHGREWLWQLIQYKFWAQEKVANCGRYFFIQLSEMPLSILLATALCPLSLTFISSLQRITWLLASIPCDPWGIAAIYQRYQEWGFFRISLEEFSQLVVSLLPWSSSSLKQTFPQNTGYLIPLLLLHLAPSGLQAHPVNVSPRKSLFIL